jgi:hypothetical protein
MHNEFTMPTAPPTHPARDTSLTHNTSIPPNISHLAFVFLCLLISDNPIHTQRKHKQTQRKQTNPHTNTKMVATTHDFADFLAPEQITTMAQLEAEEENKKQEKKNKGMKKLGSWMARKMQMQFGAKEKKADKKDRYGKVKME